MVAGNRISIKDSTVGPKIPQHSLMEFNVARWKFPLKKRTREWERNNNVVDKLLTRLLNDLFDTIYFTASKHQLENPKA